MLSVGALTAFRTSSARTFAVNEMLNSITQLNAKKKGLTSFLRTFCSFAFIIDFNLVLSFMSTNTDRWNIVSFVSKKITGPFDPFLLASRLTQPATRNPL